MLQTDSAPLSGMAQRGQADGGIGGIINIGVGFIRRQYLVAIVTAALGLVGAVIYLLITPATYSAQAQIILANPPQLAAQQSLTAAPPFDVSQIETQLQIIKSRPIAIAVINQLKLEDDRDLRASRPSFFSELWHRILTWVSPQPNDPQVAAADQPPEDVIKEFLERLSTSRVDFSNVIEVSFTSSRPERAAEIANAVAKAYIADQFNSRLDANRAATNWLQERLRDLGEQAVAAERAVSTYRSQNNIISSDGKPIDELRVTELNSRLVAARAQAADALAKLNRYETILGANSSDSSSIGTLDAVAGDASSSSIISTLRQEYLEMVRRESDYSARFGPDHRAVIDLKTRMRDVRASILDEVRRLAELTRGELEVAQQRQAGIAKELAEAVSQARSTNAAEMTIRGLENQARTFRSMYDTFLHSYTGSAQQETFPITETRVLSPASPLQLKIKPKTKKVLMMGILGGLALGIALGLLREIMDPVFRTSAQIERVLELPCLSLVPLVHGLKPASNTPTPEQAEEDLKRRFISTKSAIHNSVIDMPLSRFAEAIRSIKLAIDLSPDRTSNQIIGITSALPNEGKTTIAAALAQLIVYSGKKVIIVDCDLRNPSLSASFAPSAATGIIEIINGNQSIEETIWRDPKTNLDFLPAVRQGPLTHTSEILSAEAMGKLFERLRENYDYIIVDLPPIAPLVDVRVTSGLIDFFILVVEWGQTKIGVIQHALHTVPNIYRCMIGTVLNKTDFKAMALYDANWNDYHSDKYYALYGFSDCREEHALNS